MMETLLETMRQVFIPGVHLEVGPTNAPAIGFYQKMGFKPLRETTDSLLMARMLSTE